MVSRYEAIALIASRWIQVQSDESWKDKKPHDLWGGLFPVRCKYLLFLVVPGVKVPVLELWSHVRVCLGFFLPNSGVDVSISTQ